VDRNYTWCREDERCHRVSQAVVDSSVWSISQTAWEHRYSTASKFEWVFPARYANLNDDAENDAGGPTICRACCDDVEHFLFSRVRCCSRARLHPNG